MAGHQLEDSELLEDLPEECTLHLNLELLGGGKKRKKKTYTKPKKIKRKHKKVKLAVLKYYRVDQASGKVTRCEYFYSCVVQPVQVTGIEFDIEGGRNCGQWPGFRRDFSGSLEVPPRILQQ